MHQNENDAQIGNIQIGNDRIGRLEMLRLAEWNGPSRPPDIHVCINQFLIFSKPDN